MPDTQAYLQLIQDLLACSCDEEINALLQVNPDLLDASFVQLLESSAQQLAEQSPEDADFLRQLAAQLDISNNADEDVIPTQDPLEYLDKIFEVIEQTQGDQQAVYVLLQQQAFTNAHLLSLEILWQDALEQASPKHHSSLATLFVLFGNLIQDFPLGNRSLNIELSIKAYQLALQVNTREALPRNWASTQHNLGDAYSERIVGNRTDNLNQAVQCFKSALQVYTRVALPQNWANTQNSLGVTYNDYVVGDRAENLERAIQCYENALLVHTYEVFPQDWAMAQSNLGKAYYERIIGSRAENLEQALEYFKNSLQVRSRDTLPQEWATTQNGLGVIYIYRIVGSRVDNLEQAIECFENALQIHNREAFPKEWATVQNNLGIAYGERIKGNRAENLEQAIQCFEKALQVRKHDALPQDWGSTQMNLGNAYLERIFGSKAENMIEAIQCYENTLRVRTRETFPQDWARTQSNLGIAYRVHAVGDQATNSKLAIECCENALQVYTRKALPENCMDTLNNLGWVQLDVKNWLVAWNSFSEAMGIIEDLRADIQASDEAKHKLADTYHRIYRGGIRACLGLGEVQQALLTLERGKTRWLAERIAYRGDLSAQTRQQLRDLRHQVAQEQAQAQPDADKLNSLRQQYNALDPLPRLDAECLASLAQGRLLLVWHLDESDQFFQVFAQFGQTLCHWRPETQDGNNLVDAFNTYRNSYYQAMNAAHHKDYPAYIDWQRNRLDQHLQAIATALCWDELFDWIAQQFPTVKELVLIPHRWLHLLPLHALPLQNGDCALDNYTVRYAPSLQILWQIQQRSQIDTLPKRWFAVQNPTKDLNFADIEVMALADLFPNSTPDDVLAHQAATLKAVKDHPALTTAPVLHFSCHGGFDLNDAMQSALSLVGKDKLDLQTIFAQQLPHAHLVTLSACETGMTDFQFEGDEYIGLSSGFLSAGARHVVSSLWSVSDISTMLLLLRFYHEWLKAGDPDVAPSLNAAQRWLRQVTVQELKGWAKTLLSDAHYAEVEYELKRRFLAANDKPYQSPFHWAAFCAVG